MAALFRVQTLLRTIAVRATMSTTSSRAATTPSLSVQPKVSLCDEVVNIEASGLSPGQLVTLKAHVYTENGKYKFESKARYKADAEGKISVPNDQSLGGSYEGIEPMGLFLFLEPVPEVAHKNPRLVKWDVTKPFDFTLQLIDEGEGQEKVITSTKMERNFMADYVERIPVKTGGAEGVLFLPEERGSSDPLPFIIDIRGLLTNLVVDRAVTLASHGFAVFAFDYFLPRRLKTRDTNVYMDSQAFLDIIDFVKAHPRLDENRIGMTSSCYGGVMMLNAATRLDLPVKCMVAAGFVDMLCVNVGWKNLDGSLLEPNPVENYTSRWNDENGKGWITFKGNNVQERLEKLKPDMHFCLEEKMNSPLLMFAHKDDEHIMSYDSTLYLKERLEKAGKSHLVEFEELPGTGHFLEVPFQPINCISSLYDPSSVGSSVQAPKLFYTNYGGQDIQQGIKDQQFAWRRIVNFFRKHLDVKEMYRNDWTDS